MFIKQTRIKKLNIPRPKNHIEAPFCYPNAVLFEDNKNIHIVNISDNNQNETIRKHFSFEKEIKSYIVHHQMLWLAFESSELTVIDVMKGLSLNFFIKNYANYKIRRFVTDGTNLFLISESGERLAAPFDRENLVSKFDMGDTDLSVTLEKARNPSKNSTKRNSAYCNGLDVFAKDDNIALSCSLTGFVDNVKCTEGDIDYIVPWGDMAVLGGRKKMWILNLKEYNITYEFENFGQHYYPLEAISNVFYYLLWDTEEVKKFFTYHCNFKFYEG